MVCWDPTSSYTPSDSDADLAVPFADDSTLEEIHDVDWSALVVVLKTTVERTRYDVRNVSDGRTHFVLVWRKICL
jgi:hypothetical protein